MLNRVEELTKELTVGVPDNDEHFIGPVIDDASFKKIMSYIEIGKEEGRLVTGGTGDDSKGYFIQPTVIADLVSNSTYYARRNLWPSCWYYKSKRFR